MTSSTAVGDGTCGWCSARIPATRGRRFCGRRCRQSAFRLRRRVVGVLGDGTRPVAGGPATSLTTSRRFAYADPPYPGLARKYYQHESTYAGEVDHAALIASLIAGGYRGWALSTSPRDLRQLLPLCPAGARVCSWVKPIGVSGLTYGAHNTWEAVIVVGGRPLRPGVRDWLRAMPARGGGSQLKGRKPLAFCAWLFDLLGMVPGDELVDLFPGSGAVSRAWLELATYGRPRVSSLEERQLLSATPSLEASGDVAGRGGRRR